MTFILEFPVADPVTWYDCETSCDRWFSTMARPFVSTRPRASCLFLSSIWPEPGSSAAGVRTQALIRAFQRQWGYDVAFAAAARPNQYTEQLRSSGIATHSVGFNREGQLADVLSACRPDVVCFDRFIAEEAFSFRVRELVPNALRILDMQDMHALRRGRQALVEADRSIGLSDVLGHTPDASSAVLLRELAALHRSDLTLVCSPAEMELLQGEYAVPADKLCLASFFCTEAARDGASGEGSKVGQGGQGGQGGFGYGASHGFGERAGFVTVGGFRHAPNVDGVGWLASELWPRIRASLPDDLRALATMHVYGAYPTSGIQALHDPSRGLLVHGHAKSLEVLASARLLLAPLRCTRGPASTPSPRSYRPREHIAYTAACCASSTHIPQAWPALLPLGGCSHLTAAAWPGLRPLRPSSGKAPVLHVSLCTCCPATSLPPLRPNADARVLSLPSGPTP